MKILCIRHAIAEDPEAFAKSAHGEADDDTRPLTKRGTKKMQRNVRGIRKLVPKIDVLASSPLTRALQTAEIIADGYAGLKTKTVAALAPGKRPGAILEWLKGHRADATIALVGHEPDLGKFVCWLLTGLHESFVTMKKGCACLLECDGHARSGHAMLQWALQPAELRKLGK